MMIKGKDTSLKSIDEIAEKYKLRINVKNYDGYFIDPMH